MRSEGSKMNRFIEPEINVPRARKSQLDTEDSTGSIDTTKVPKLGKSKSVQSRTKSIRIWFAHAQVLSGLKKLS